MINIAELLKDCPEDTKLYSILLGEVQFIGIDEGSDYPIDVKDSYGAIQSFSKFGTFFNEYPDAGCLLFPSKDCRTWEGWKAPIEPKFKVGDEVYNRFDKSSGHVVIESIDETTYYCDATNFDIVDQDDYELVPKFHYAIANFHVGMPVLVRDYDNSRWSYVQFSHYVGEECRFKFNACGIPYIQCIPFNEDTKHLLGTTDMCPEEYINW